MDDKLSKEEFDKLKEEILNYAIDNKFSDVVIKDIKECDSEGTLGMLKSLKDQNNLTDLNANYIFWFE